MEVWLHAFAIPGQVAETARRAEAWGFDGLLIADSQNLTADIWIELALAGAATSRLRLGPGDTNPVTRHIAVTASAAATLQVETNGRATLGFARGDSALSQIGRRPEAAGEFERSLQRLQGLLRGEQVQLSEGPSQIRWLAASPMAKVPVHVAASGHRVITTAARHAEGVDLTLGAELERIRWGTRLVRRAATGGAGAVSIGAYVNVAVDPDRDTARRLVRGSVSTFARFSSGSELSAATSGGVAQAARSYEAARHGEAAAAGARGLEPEFIDRFAVAGPPAEVAERLTAIGAEGVHRLIVVPCSLDSDRADVDASNERFAREVLPGLRPGRRARPG